MDKECRNFEIKFSAFQECQSLYFFNSGGSANLAMLQALKNLGRLKDGDKIGFSALTWSMNTMPIIQLGMIPVALDCEQLDLKYLFKEIFFRGFWLIRILKPYF